MRPSYDYDDSEASCEEALPTRPKKTARVQKRFHFFLSANEVVEETDRQTARGLEFRTRQGAIRRQHNKVEAISAVLEEQGRHINRLGYVDDEQLADVYIQVNKHCQDEAHELALGDVEPAREYLSDVSAEFLRKQYLLMMADKNENDYDDADTRFVVPERKKSFGKLLYQMRIRRRPALTQEATDDRPPVRPGASRPITGSAA
jgi:hypothetical protein